MGRAGAVRTVDGLSSAPPAHRSLGAVLDLACDLLGIGGDRARRLHATRSGGLDGVLATAHRIGGQVRGSWRWGDFHLDERSGWSCSDLDLHGGTPPLDGHVDSPLGRLRVSVHAVDYEPMISPRVSFSFALVNLAAARLAPEADPYVLGKCQLMLARASVDERYADVACRVGGPAGAWLLARKLGIHQPAPPSWAPSVPVTAPPAELAAVLEQLLAGPPARRELEALRAYIEDELDELDERHRRYVARKVVVLTTGAGVG